ALFEQAWLKVQPVWRTPFDAAKPVDTPNDIAPDPRLAGWLADAVLDLQGAGVPLDAAGDARFITRQGERVPVQGAHGAIGAPDVMTYALGPHGYGEPYHGSSYVQAVTFDARGPVAEAVLTYGQSQDLDDPHSGDQARLWAQKQWVRLPFHEAEVAAGTLERVALRG
ncbi:MAG: penicillin acylase family protein, partial [Halobacteriales archaeon]|nr:penicillin acylase family protein [Halobacteriales archaeon]